MRPVISFYASVSLVLFELYSTCCGSKLLGVWFRNICCQVTYNIKCDCPWTVTYSTLQQRENSATEFLSP
jgi:hypothetical protein